MKNFTFYSPTKIIFGKDAERKTAAEIKKLGGSRVLIVYGGGSVLKSGLLSAIKNQLKEEGLPYTMLGGVQPNPRLSFARAGVKLALDFGADFVLAVGGGSVIDTAKGICLGVADPKTDLWAYWLKEATPKTSLPLGVVLTISAAGSETSDSAVLTDEETGSKRGLGTDLNRPKFAVMNPELTYSLPSYQIACGIVDIMMHTLDRYFTPTEGNSLTDELAESVLRVVIENGIKAMKDSHDYDAMSEIMWCGSLSHNNLTGLGAVPDFSTHGIGHELSARFDVAHGASLSTVWGSWALSCYQLKPKRFARYARTVWGIAEEDEVRAAVMGIRRTEDYFTSIGMPICFTQLGVGIQSDEVLRDMAIRSTFYGARTIGSFKVLSVDDIFEIYKAANR